MSTKNLTRQQKSLPCHIHCHGVHQSSESDKLDGNYNDDLNPKRSANEIGDFMKFRINYLNCRCESHMIIVMSDPLMFCGFQISDIHSPVIIRAEYYLLE